MRCLLTWLYLHPHRMQKCGWVQTCTQLCTLHICNLHIADLHASPTHSSQLTCLPVGWWLHQVTFADIAVIMVCTKFADVCIFGSFAQICSRSARIYCKPAQIAPLLLIYCKSAAICCMCVSDSNAGLIAQVLWKPTQAEWLHLL